MIIALTGLAGSGKDTAAEIIAEIVDGFVVALADLPKDMASRHFRIPVYYFHDRELKDRIYAAEGRTPRDLLVGWWDRLFFEHGDDYSLRMNIKKIDEILNYEKHVIVSDIRYPIEFDWVKKENILLLNIQRNDVESTIDHHTESGSDKGIIVDNNGTIEDLRNTLIEMFQGEHSIV